jgi:hypothetical protein
LNNIKFIAAIVQSQIFKDWTPRIECVCKRTVQRHTRKIQPFEATEGRAKTRDPEVLPIHWHGFEAPEVGD